MKHRYLINLLDPECYLSVSQMFNPETGALEEDQRIISLPEGPHQMLDFVDTIMYGTARYHEHSVGWETFFITTGCCDLTVRGKTCRLVPGDIIHIQPWMGHQMSFPEPTVYRGIFHDLNMSGTLRGLAYIREVNPKQLEGLASFQRYLMRADNIIRETPLSVCVPKEEVPEARTPDRPLSVFEFEGITLKQYTGRWENNGLTELWKAEMDDGFTARFYEDDPNTDLFYIVEGSVGFSVAGEEFTATRDCLVKIPGYAPRAFTAQGRAVMFDLAGITHWLDLFEDYTSIKANAPERLGDKDGMAALKAKYNCQIASFGIKE
ncbi:Cupin domain-containing protein [Sporobacter termitidis DSM 10068]|uniref:Cupin domain-containing protein n=1 Tax=Sporobacter termitidis DSM 10068 TaxID=1123282 RepID=A0A1M5YXW3_9FIRM|nr:cupin domain-containing protein [Sporobacter termitidis]SHI16825.1 Cupin domain-containing protein [Sporobacter termitidis DSM 10068]